MGVRVGKLHWSGGGLLPNQPMMVGCVVVHTGGRRGRDVWKGVAVPAPVEFDAAGVINVSLRAFISL